MPWLVAIAALVILLLGLIQVVESLPEGWVTGLVAILGVLSSFWLAGSLKERVEQRWPPSH